MLTQEPSTLIDFIIVAAFDPEISLRDRRTSSACLPRP